MGYTQYLRELLEPLGVYAFSAGSLSLSELAALGAALDGAKDLLETAEREALAATAEEEGLDRRAAAQAAIQRVRSVSSGASKHGRKASSPSFFSPRAPHSLP